MKITFPEITQEDFYYAIECLEVCKQPDAKEFGFNYPYFTPGGHYGKQWWQIDSSLALCGYKWVDREFAERALLNFIESQKDDGRICLWGADELPGRVAGNSFPEQTKNVSSLPKIFDVAFHILKGSDDRELKEKTYNMLRKYAYWWLENRKDEKTGLISSVFEETFIPYLGSAHEYAAVDTNVEVYVGLHYTVLLALELDKEEEAKLLNAKKSALGDSINKYMWDEKVGAYFPYDLKKGELLPTLMASCFYPLRLSIAPANRQKRLIQLMQDSEHFGWNEIPLTSVSKKDPVFTTTKGAYQGNASWSGNVWTLINETVVRGLIDCGEKELAADLALKTVYAFNHNCAEFVHPFDGSGNGVIQYAWSASQYIELLTEVLFGISYDAKTKSVTVEPILTGALENAKLEISGLEIVKGVYLDVTLDCGKTGYRISDDKISVRVPKLEKEVVKACRLLLNCGLSLTDTAAKCNICDFDSTFEKLTGFAPAEFKEKFSGRNIHSFNTLDDIKLMAKMPFLSVKGAMKDVEYKASEPYIHINDPDDKSGHFLHEAAIIEHKGVLYCSWYNNMEVVELVGYTPIRQKRSYDGGKTWSDFETIASDESGKILYCPPVYGICDGKLYMLINEMVSADHIHALDLYVLNEETDKFELLWSRPIPFKLNTNVIKLPNGKLLLPGRIAELDGFPNTPAVLISDSGKIDAEWRPVYVAENGDLPDGTKLVHPEATVVCCDNTLYMFNRNDDRGIPLVYVSDDLGESWGIAACHDIPYISSKIYAGQLSDGRYYLIANIDDYDRNKLALYVSEKDKMTFTRRMILCDCKEQDIGIRRCHYPAAVEYDGALHIIASADYKKETGLNGRGAVLFKVDIKDI